MKGIIIHLLSLNLTETFSCESLNSSIFVTISQKRLSTDIDNLTKFIFKNRIKISFKAEDYYFLKYFSKQMFNKFERKKTIALF